MNTSSSSLMVRSLRSLVGRSLVGTFAFVALSAVAAEPLHAAPGQTLALEVNGPAVNPGKQRRCEDVARRHGFMLMGQAPIRVMLSLQPGYNRLLVTSARRGQIIDSPRPGWGMDQLCEDAMQVAERAYANEGQPPVAVAPAYPPAPSPYPPAPNPYPPANAYPPAPSEYPPAPSGYAPPPGAMMIALDVTGPFTNPGKVERCMRVAQRRGFTINPQAPVRVMLVLQPGFNRLQINSASRGELLNQPKPGWGMDQLCEDAMNYAAQMVSQEGRGGPHRHHQAAPPPPAPAPAQMALGPIPPSDNLQPTAKQAADAAVVAWQGAQFDAALAGFREADRRGTDPQFLFDMAVCEQRLGRHAEALTHAEQFVQRAPQSPYRPYGDQLIQELHAAMGR